MPSPTFAVEREIAAPPEVVARILEVVPPDNLDPLWGENRRETVASEPGRRRYRETAGARTSMVEVRRSSPTGWLRRIEMSTGGWLDATFEVEANLRPSTVGTHVEWSARVEPARAGSTVGLRTMVGVFRRSLEEGADVTVRESLALAAGPARPSAGGTLPSRRGSSRVAGYSRGTSGAIAGLAVVGVGALWLALLLSIGSSPPSHGTLSGLLAVGLLSLAAALLLAGLLAGLLARLHEVRVEPTGVVLVVPHRRPWRVEWSGLRLSAMRPSKDRFRVRARRTAGSRDAVTVLLTADDAREIVERAPAGVRLPPPSVLRALGLDPARGGGSID